MMKGPAFLRWAPCSAPPLPPILAPHPRRFPPSQDSVSGSIRVERGEQLVFPTATEAPLDADGVVDAIDLKAWEYVAVQEMSSGKVRERA